MIKLMPKRFTRNSSSNNSKSGSCCGGIAPGRNNIKWELRPGGMLVQKRSETEENVDQVVITIRVSTVSQCHDILVQATSTFGELKILISLLTELEPKAQRVLFKGKEREDHEHLHMVGVKDGDKVLLLEDPALKERKLLGLDRVRSPYRTITV